VTDLRSAFGQVVRSTREAQEGTSPVRAQTQASFRRCASLHPWGKPQVGDYGRTGLLPLRRPAVASPPAKALRSCPIVRGGAGRANPWRLDLRNLRGRRNPSGQDHEGQPVAVTPAAPQCGKTLEGRWNPKNVPEGRPSGGADGGGNRRGRPVCLRAYWNRTARTERSSPGRAAVCWSRSAPTCRGGTADAKWTPPCRNVEGAKNLKRGALAEKTTFLVVLDAQGRAATQPLEVGRSPWGEYPPFARAGKRLRGNTVQAGLRSLRPRPSRRTRSVATRGRANPEGPENTMNAAEPGDRSSKGPDAGARRRPRETLKRQSRTCPPPRARPTSVDLERGGCGGGEPGRAKLLFRCWSRLLRDRRRCKPAARSAASPTQVGFVRCRGLRFGGVSRRGQQPRWLLAPPSISVLWRGPRRSRSAGCYRNRW